MRSQRQKAKRDDFIRVLRACIPAIAMALGLSFVASLAMFVPPLYMMNLFSTVSHSGSIATLIGLSIIAAGGIALYAVFEYLRSQVYQSVGAWLGSRLSEEAMEPIVQQSIRGRASASEVLRDIGDLRNFVSGSALTAGLEFFWSPMFFLALFVLHPFFGWLGVIGGLLILMLALANELLTRSLITEASDKGVATYNEIGNALRNGETIEAMGLLGNVLRRWTIRNDELLGIGRKAARRQSAVSSASKGLRLLIQMAVFGGGMVFVLQHELAPGALIAGSIILGRALGPVEALIDGWRQWVTAGAALRRALAVIEDHAGSPRSTMPLPRPQHSLEIEKVVLAPPGSSRPILRGVTLSVRRGEMVCIVGSSAAGKTSLLRLIAGIWAPTAGSVRLDGHDVHTWDRSDFGRHVGYLPQSVELFGATVRDNIARLGEHDPETVVKAAKAAGIHGMIGTFPNGYDTRIGDGGFALTGGQRQRIGIARALYGDPALLILDEPDASLDADGQHALAETLAERRMEGCMIVVVTHRPQLLRGADRIVRLEQGLVARVLRPEDLDRDGIEQAPRPMPIGKPA